MKIHFVCTANTFRSRLAEAYLNSKKIPGISASSSGIEATKNENGPISWYAQRIIEQNKLVPFEKLTWTQSTKELLESQDIVIFMQKWHFDQAVAKFKFMGKNCKIWDIEDVTHKEYLEDNVIPKTEEIYTKIKLNVENLIARNFKS